VACPDATRLGEAGVDSEDASPAVVAEFVDVDAASAGLELAAVEVVGWGVELETVTVVVFVEPHPQTTIPHVMMSAMERYMTGALFDSGCVRKTFCEFRGTGWSASGSWRPSVEVANGFMHV
jgi:hypothetical protein